jgi:hypothetical protein
MHRAFRPLRRHTRCTITRVHMRHWLATVALVGPMGLGLLASCRSSLPGPPPVPQPGEAFTEVPYPPPPAKVEYVPEQPRSDARWVDGQWRWESSRWRWERGGWYLVPADVGFARWETRRTPEGRLIFAPATWRERDGGQAPVPPMLVRAGAGPNQMERDAGGHARDGSTDAEWMDAPTMFDGDLYDAAVLAAPIILESGPGGGLDDVEPLVAPVPTREGGFP